MCLFTSKILCRLSRIFIVVFVPKVKWYFLNTDFSTFSLSEQSLKTSRSLASSPLLTKSMHIWSVEIVLIIIIFNIYKAQINM